MSAIAHLDMEATFRGLEKILPAPIKRIKIKNSQSRRTPTANCEHPYLQKLPRLELPPSHPFPPQEMAGPNFSPYNDYMNKDVNHLEENQRWYARIKDDDDDDDHNDDQSSTSDTGRGTSDDGKKKDNAYNDRTLSTNRKNSKKDNKFGQKKNLKSGLVTLPYSDETVGSECGNDPKQNEKNDSSSIELINEPRTSIGADQSNEATKKKGCFPCLCFPYCRTIESQESSKNIDNVSAKNSDKIASETKSKRYDSNGIVDNLNRADILSDILDRLNGKDKVKKLFEEFWPAVQCHCRDNHLNAGAPQLVYKVQLDNATTVAEFEALVMQYRRQLLIRALTSQLLFRSCPDLPNLQVCINCKRCIADFEMLQRMRLQNLAAVSDYSASYSINYDGAIKMNIFGSVNQSAVTEMLVEFNDMAPSNGITICVKDLWRLELKLWSDRVEFNEYLESESNQQLLQNSCTDLNSEECVKKMIAALNPYSRRKMGTLLEIALQKLSTNPKYVLASMPNAKDMPILREWMRHRYGHKYSADERKRSLKRSREQWSELEKHKLRISIPRPGDVAKIGNHFDFNDRDKMMKCVCCITLIHKR